MARKTNQAVRTQEIQADKDAKARFLFRVTYVILAISLVLLGWSMVRHSNIFTLKQVVINGQYNKTDPSDFKTILEPYLHTSLLQLKTEVLSQQLQELPWVAMAVVKRSWPNRLVIILTQKTPVARWHNDGLITADGDIFFPGVATIPINLPTLKTPADLIREAIALLMQARSTVVGVNLQIKELILTERQETTLILQTRDASSPKQNAAPLTIKVLLGQTDIQERLQRFIDIYPKVFANRLDQVQYADMRYANGMAVKWKQQND